MNPASSHTAVMRGSFIADTLRGDRSRDEILFLLSMKCNPLFFLNYVLLSCFCCSGHFIRKD